jgi:hypothetical protein
VITPQKDAYGPEADRSNLADYLELLSLHGKVLRRAELADFLKDREWDVRSRELYSDPGASGEPPEDAEDGGVGASPSEVAAGDIFEILRLRADTLGGLYPYAVSETQLTLHDDLTNGQRSYLALLAVTVAHHHGAVLTGTDLLAERVFEECVAQAMRDHGLLTVDSGQAGREGGGFAELVRKVAETVQLVSAPEDAIFRTHAKEEGVDTVSHLSWGDRRAGHWVFIGQATCARSNEWGAKIEEPRPKQWSDLLTCAVPPIAYLAVPHHVEDAQLDALSRNHGKLVLDRLRLARHLGPLSENQVAILEAIRAEDVYHPSQ